MKTISKILRDENKHFKWGHQKIAPKRSQDTKDTVDYSLQGPLQCMTNKKRYGHPATRKFAGQTDYIAKVKE